MSLDDRGFDRPHFEVIVEAALGSVLGIVDSTALIGTGVIVSSDLAYIDL